ncbi:MAG TPA: sugar phosphate isomerase/epimerase [Chloroflexi bacterium]|nr:sugar phosphate isomerase/epimerase [Chloroflexota bacterium]
MIAFSTGSLYTYGMARVFDLAAQAGYDGIEVLVDHRWDSRQPAYLRRLSADYGLPILVIHSPFVPEVVGWPADQLGRLRRSVALAQEVGASTVVTHLPFRFCFVMGHWNGHRPRRFLLPVPFLRREPYYHLLRDGLDELMALEAESGVTIAVENMPSNRVLGMPVNGYWFNTPAELERFPHLTLDTTHLGTWGLDPLAVYRQLGERVVHVHLSDFDGREHRLPADGWLGLERLLRQMARDGYRHVITVETDPSAMDVEEEGPCLEAVRRGLAFCREHFNPQRTP